MNKSRMTVICLFVGLCACSSHVDPPSLNSPIRPISTQACKDAKLDLRFLEAKGIRALVTCLNGENGAIQPYKDFLDHIDTHEFNQILQVYNRHINGPNHRLNKILDLVDRMEKAGFLKTFYKDFQVVAETKTLQTLIPLLRHFFSEETKEVLDPTIERLLRFAVDVIDKDLSSPGFISMASVFGGLRAKVLAYLISRAAPDSKMTTREIVDHVSAMVLKSFSDGSFHQMTTHLTDPQVGRILKRMDDKDLRDLAEMTSFLAWDSTTKSSNGRWNKLQQAINGSDRSLRCFTQGSKTLEQENILRFFAKEGLNHSNTESANRFFLQTVPIMLAASQTSCDYHSDLINNADLLTEIVNRGYGDGLRSSLKFLIQSQRFEETARLLKSHYMKDFGPLFSEFSLRGGFQYLLEIFGRDITDADIETLVELLNYFIAPDLKGKVLSDWVDKKISGVSKNIILSQLELLPPDRKSLSELTKVLQQNPLYDSAFRDLKEALAQTHFDDSFESSFIKIAEKMLINSNDRRQEIVDFADAVKRALADQRGGFGDFLDIIARSTLLSHERPVQEAIRDAFADEELMEEVAPLVFKLSKDPYFLRTIDFTGQIAGNGQLEILMRFLIELFKNSHQLGLAPGGPNYAYSPTRGDPVATVANHTPYSLTPPAGDYTFCTKIKGTLFDHTGENLYNVLRCANATGSVSELSQIAETLKTNNLLGPLSDILNNLLATSPHVGGGLEQLEKLFKSGYLTTLLQLFVIATEKPYELPYQLDPVFLTAFKNNNLELGLEWMSQILKTPKLTESTQLLVELFNRKPQKTLQSQNIVPLEVHDPSAIKKRMKELKEDWSDKQIEDAYKKAEFNFRNRTDAWYYEEGFYKRLNDNRWANEIFLNTRDLLRTTDLPELIAALQDVFKNMEVEKHLKAAVETQTVVLNYNTNLDRIFHIQTQLDQLEALVLVSDIDVPLGSINHVGTDFQLAIVKASDLVEEMKSQRKKLDLGITLYTFDKRRSFHLRNMRENFQALDDWAKSGALRILQRIYRALYNATPSKYRDKDDPINNHMATLNHLNNVGVFDNLTLAVTSLKKQNQYDHMMAAVKNLILQIKSDDIEPLRNLIIALLTPYDNEFISPLENLISQFLKIQKENPEGYQNLKNTLFHLVANSDRISDQATPVLEAFAGLISNKHSWRDLTHTFFENAQMPENGIYTLGANLLKMNNVGWDMFKEVCHSALLAQTKTKQWLLPRVAELATSTYSSHAEKLNDWSSRFNQYKNDPRVQAIGPYPFFINFFGELRTTSGLGDGLALVLENPFYRQKIRETGEKFGEQNHFTQISEVLLRQINSGSVDSALHFLFDNFKIKP